MRLKIAMIYLNYLKSLLKHKWYVFVECCKLGIPVMGIIHDWSKFMPVEFIAYARKFYGEYPTKEQAIRRYPYGTISTQESVKEDFDIAWNHHQKLNKHHWQYWVIVFDSELEKVKCLNVPEIYRKEMLADWIGAGRAYGKQEQNNNNPDTQQWYLDNRDKLILHPETRQWIETQLHVNG